MARLPIWCAVSVSATVFLSAPVCAVTASATASVATPAPNLFGTIALPVARTALDAKWRQARFVGRHPSATSLRLGLRDLAVVQRDINRRLSYRADSPQVSDGDSWSTAANSLARGSGDCEDYAIAKGQSLLALGFNAHDLFLIIGNDLTLRSAHAILVVRLAGKYWVLDNLAHRVVEAGQFRNFSPIITFSADRKWVHGYDRDAGAHLASAPTRSLDLAANRLSAIKVAQTATAAGRSPIP